MVTRVLLAGLLAIALHAAPAQAADAFRPTPGGCFALNGPDCTALASGDGLWQVKLSPDKKFLYATAWFTGALHVFSRNATTSALTHVKCYSETEVTGCTDVVGLAQPDDIEITPDGEYLYVSSWTGTIAAFDRDTGSGLLNQPGPGKPCISDDGDGGVCDDGRGIAIPSGMVMSPDGKHLYAAQANAPSVVALRIESDGTLAQIAGQGGCVNNEGSDGCADGRALSTGALQLAISPDGAQVFVPSGGDQRGVVVLDRDPATGALTQPAGTSGCVTFGGGSGDPAKPCAAEGRIGTSVGTTHAVGNVVYLASNGSIITFRREGGGLVAQSCINDTGAGGCADGRNSADLAYANHSPDGQHLLVGTANSNRLTIYARDASGNLTSVPGPDGCLNLHGNAVDNAVTQAGGCTVSPAAGEGLVEFADDSHFYAGNYDRDAIGVFTRDFYPQCQDKAVDVPHNTAKAIDLVCADRDGEAVELEIVTAPVSGSVGVIDQAADRVFYNPFAGYSGADSFTYRGKAGALTSPTATVGLTVGASTADNDKDGVSPPADCDDANAAVRPGAAEVPGNGVDEDCVGGDQALPPGRIAAGVDYFFDARSKRFTRVGRLIVTNVIAGATVEVRCKGKGCRFKSKKRTLTKAAAKHNVKGYFNFKRKRRRIVTKLKKGSTVQIRVTAPGLIGKVITFKTRSGRVPTFVVSCLPVGSTTPRSVC